MDEDEVIEYLPKKERDALPDEVFAGPGRTFPCDTQAHVDAAATLYGHAANPDEVKASIIRIARKHGFSLPKSWQDETKESSDVSPNASSASPQPQSARTQEPLPAQQPQSAQPSQTDHAPLFVPKARIATLTTRFLRNGAQSLNGRIYPRETVERLVQSAQTALSNPDAPMLTCYTSHDAADRQDPINLSGRITRVWQEGDNAYATFDIPDTTAGRDMVALVSGGYLKTMSLRAKNAELKLEKGYSLPIVTGSPQLEGIDFAPTPGLPDVAQIQQVTVESATGGTLIETFALSTADVVLETAQETPMPTLKEQAAATQTEALAAIAAVQETLAISESLPLLKQNMQQAHDHIAEMLAMPCCKGGKAKEAGRSISRANSDKLGAAHDALALALGTECRYSPDDPATDADPDGDADLDTTDDPAQNPDAQQDDAQNNMDENHRGDTPDMTREELLAQLQAEGFKVEAPKTAEEKREAELAEKLAEMERKFEERLAKLAPATPPAPTQRQTLVEGANTRPANRPADPRIYRHGDYLREKLQVATWPELADRSRPLPDGISPRYLIKEFSELLAGIIEENYV